MVHHTGQGMSAAMKVFTDELENIEEAMFTTKTHAQVVADVTVKCACGELALFRCPECGWGDMVCAPCLVKMHPHHRFHHVERWDGSAFVRTELIEWKHEVHLGHSGGERCPNASTPVGRKTVLVDTNGIHSARIFYCHCGNPAVKDHLAHSCASLPRHGRKPPDRIYF
jgi:hypothetical protein